MKAFYHFGQALHDPKFYMKNGNKIQAREVPLRGKIFNDTLANMQVPILESNDFGFEYISKVHSPDYLSFFRKSFEEWQKLPDSSEEIIPKSNPGRYASSYPKDIVGQVGWHLMDTSCPIGAGTWQGAYASAQTAASAADLVAIEQSKYSYAVCRPPGHHAYKDGCAGFCFLNNAAIATERLLKRYDKVAIIDVDLHHGNGTQSIFWYRKDVMTISIHADPAYCYPHYWGYEHERGEADGYGYNLNIPIPESTDDKGYMSYLEKALDALELFNPDAIVIALGLDASEQDPFAVLKISTQGFEEIAFNIKQVNKPTVIVQEGGYISPILGKNLEAFLKPFC